MSRSIVGSGDLCWSVGFSVEVLPSLVQSAGEASLLKINFSGPLLQNSKDIIKFLSLRTVYWHPLWVN